MSKGYMGVADFEVLDARSEEEMKAMLTGVSKVKYFPTGEMFKVHVPGPSHMRSSGTSIYFQVVYKRES